MRTLILTCTPDRFDVASYFKDNSEILWRQTKKCDNGDFAYIYVGRPLSQIKYLCEVVETDIPTERVELDYYQKQVSTVRTKDKPYMRLKLIRELSCKDLTLGNLLSHGLKTVQCTTEASPELANYLSAIVRRCNNGNTYS